MSTRTRVETVNADTAKTGLIATMRGAEGRKLSTMKGRITKAVNARRDKETENLGPNESLSKDFAELERWTTSNAVAALFMSLEIDPHVYIMQPFLEDAKLVKAGFDTQARTRNLKAYKKVRELSEYIMNGDSKLEAVFKTFVACGIIASSKTDILKRDVCERFLSSIPLTDVSEDLAEAIDAFQAKHMSGGAQTQASQCILTLANLKAGSIVRDGRNKHLKLDAKSQVIQALAERFGMTEQLNTVAV